VLFNSVQFAIFFLVLMAIYRQTPAQHRASILLAFSLVFYVMWIPAYLLVFLADIAVNYFLLRRMQRSASPRHWVIGAVAFNLGFLGFFKYAAFFVASVAPIMSWATGEAATVPGILLPLGVSFYTFQILALTIDVYRGRVEEVRSLREYTLFISFFPQLIAGPILRGNEFLPQLRAGGRVSAEWTRRGLWLIVVGLGKKVVLADFLLAPFVNPVFDRPEIQTAPVQLIALYSFAFQIYFDFSGYTDIARGLARLLGFELPLNFQEPYLSRSPAEFWQRWHMTLSRWLRDYLYIPLGGNRRGQSRTYVNLLLTMLLGGLWHGAAWSFVVWGGLHGVLLAVHRRWGGARRRSDRPLVWRDAFKIFLTFQAVSFVWIFFRATSIEGAMTIIQTLTTQSYLTGWPILPTLVVLLCASLQLVERWCRTRQPMLLDRLTRGYGPLVEGAVGGAVAALAVTLLGAAGAEFIYFQF
jgi:alginate O-acetyltransferase complex protein AlgI